MIDMIRKINKSKKNLIFLHNIQHEKNKNTKKKLYFKWNELYRIFKIVDNKNIYLLTELNNTEIMSIFAKNWFKKFHVRFFNASKQIKNSVKSRIIIDRFSFFEIFSKLEFVGLATVWLSPRIFRCIYDYQNTMMVRTDFLAMVVECLFTLGAATKSCDFPHG